MPDLKTGEFALRLHNERRRIKVIEERLEAYEDPTDDEVIELRITLSRIALAINDIVEDMRRLEPQHT